MRSRSGGFTMIELMITVAVLGILVTVAVVAYTRNIRKARAGEVPEVFGKIHTAENTYYAEHGHYVAMCPTLGAGALYADCAEGDYWPATLPGSGAAMDASSPPARWSMLKINLGRGSLYCQYEVIAGLAGDDDNIGAIGAEMFPTTPTRNWYYVMAQCDWDGDSTTKATYWQRDDWTIVGRANEGR